MKFTAVVALALASVAVAQTAADIPKCAVPCLDASVKKVTTCSTTDYKCICKADNFSKIQNDATNCVIKACGADVAISKPSPLCLYFPLLVCSAFANIVTS